MHVQIGKGLLMARHKFGVWAPMWSNTFDVHILNTDCNLWRNLGQWKKQLSIRPQLQVLRPVMPATWRRIWAARPWNWVTTVLGFRTSWWGVEMSYEPLKKIRIYNISRVDSTQNYKGIDKELLLLFSKFRCFHDHDYFFNLARHLKTWMSLWKQGELVDDVANPRLVMFSFYHTIFWFIRWNLRWVYLCILFWFRNSCDLADSEANRYHIVIASLYQLHPLRRTSPRNPMTCRLAPCRLRCWVP